VNREPSCGGHPGVRYIRPVAPALASSYKRENHYDTYQDILADVYNDEAPFEKRAVVTELYFCSTANTEVVPGKEPLDWRSPCAKEYLGRVIEQVQPSVIIAAGRPPRDYLRQKAIDKTTDTNPFRARIELPLGSQVGQAFEAWVFAIVHPSRRGSVSTEVRETALAQAKEGTRRILIDHQLPVLHPVVRAQRRPMRWPPEPKTDTEWWPWLLAPTEEVPWLGEMLASHPDSDMLTRGLLEDLTVRKLVRIANVQHNTCTQKKIETLNPADRSRDPKLAWKTLLAGVARPERERKNGSGWSRTVTILSADDGARTGLAAVKAMSIGSLIDLCDRIAIVLYRIALSRRSD
jgi:hypothetical protein